MLVYLDSAICLYAVEGPPALRQRAAARLAAIAAAGDSFAVSDLSWVECRVKPMRLGDSAALAEMERFLGSPGIDRLPISAAVCEQACRLMAGQRIKTADALHLGAAIEGGCSVFLTNDVRLLQVSGIAVEALP